MKVSIFKNKKTSGPEIFKSLQVNGYRTTSNEQKRDFTVCNLQNNTNFRLGYLMQACNQGIAGSKDQFQTIASKSILSI